jgi:hypothetical protein
LSSSTPRDQPGAFEHLDVLRDGGERHFERLGELVDGRRTVCEAGKDRSSRRAGQCGKRLAEPILLDRHRPVALRIVPNS